MIEMVEVTEVKALPHHRLRLRFSDGSEGVHDLAPILAKGGSMVSALNDPAMFERVYISFGVPTWPNGFDLDAINLHRQLREQGLLKRPAA